MNARPRRNAARDANRAARASLARIVAAAFVRRLLLATATAVVVAAIAGAAGCADQAAPASRIVSVRVLGARVEAGGDPMRTSPRPGETAHVTWLVVAPG